MAIALRSNSAQITHVKPGIETSFTLTTAEDVVAGDHVYLFIHGWQGEPTDGALISNVTDDQSGIWSQIFTRRAAGLNHVISLWRGTGATGGAPLTAELFYNQEGPAGTWSCAIVSAGGMAAAAIDAGNTNASANGTTVTTATIATTVADTLVFAHAFAVENGGGTIDVPAGWTLLEEHEASEPFSVVYKILTATDASLSATWTTSNSMLVPISIIAAFAADSGGGGGTPSRAHFLPLLGVG